MADIRLEVSQDAGARRAFALHPRVWQENRYVYPVVSRRSKGISIGVNLNPDKVCNFDCIYCCVNRREKPEIRNPKPETKDGIDLHILRQELSQMLTAVQSGAIYAFDPFDKIPAALRRVNDIAFSGDGEPTSCANFLQACTVAAEELKKSQAAGPAPADPIKLVVITNATLFHHERVRDAFAFLDHHHGEIWAKLDAGTDPYYHLVDRTSVSFKRVLQNLQWCCQLRPTVIQSLFMKIHNLPPPAEEIAAYTKRLAEIVRLGGRIKLVQLYTVARATTEAYATPLSQEELEKIAQQVRTEVPAAQVEVYP